MQLVRIAHGWWNMRAPRQSRAGHLLLNFSTLCATATIGSGITGVTAFQMRHRQSGQRFISGSSTSSLIARASPSLLDDDEYVSPNQMKALRKEVSKRRARKKLTQYKMPEAECHGNFSDGTLDAISELLAMNELVVVRGISRDKKRNVFATTEKLGMVLSGKGKFVTTIEIKGFSSTFYRPGDDDIENKIIRRTNYKEGQWKKKPKPKRDNRGQIIPGQYETPNE